MPSYFLRSFRSRTPLVAGMALCLAIFSVGQLASAEARGGTAVPAPANPPAKAPPVVKRPPANAKPPSAPATPPIKTPPIKTPPVKSKAEIALDACFARFEQSWRGGIAKGVVGCMPKKGSVRVRLLHAGTEARVVDANFAKNQAIQALSKYFGATSKRGLLRVMPAPKKPGRNSAHATPTVRKYKYTYRPFRSNTVTTHLTVQVRPAQKGWVLAAVTEQKPPRRK